MNEAEARFVAQMENRLAAAEAKIAMLTEHVDTLAAHGGCWSYVHGGSWNVDGGRTLAGQDFHNTVDALVQSIWKLRRLLFRDGPLPSLPVDSTLARWGDRFHGEHVTGRGAGEVPDR